MFNYDILNRRIDGSPQSYLRPKSVFHPEYDAFYDRRPAMTREPPLPAEERRENERLKKKFQAEMDALDGKKTLPIPATPSALSDFESLGLDTSTLGEQQSQSGASTRRRALLCPSNPVRVPDPVALLSDPPCTFLSFLTPLLCGDDRQSADSEQRCPRECDVRSDSGPPARPAPALRPEVTPNNPNPNPRSSPLSCVPTLPTILASTHPEAEPSFDSPRTPTPANARRPRGLSLRMTSHGPSISTQTARAPPTLGCPSPSSAPVP